MEAKIKAKELVEKFLRYTPVEFEYDYAKQCALIAAIEMIQISNEAMLFKQSKREWLQEVKQEIEKL
jgi:hypothetical protein